jgi:uncharacterized RDD family membrane protein YckC
MRRAGFGIRLGAALIDLVLLYVVQFLGSTCVIPLFAVAQRERTPGAGPPPVLEVAMGISAVLWLAYTATELFGPASPGKRILKLRIASADGGPAGAWQAVPRWAMKYSPMFAYLVAMAALVVMSEARSQAANAVSYEALLLPNVIALLVMAVVLGGFFATLGPKKQALHDVLAGTVVLRPGAEPQGFAPILARPVIPADAPTPSALPRE